MKLVAAALVALALHQPAALVALALHQPVALHQPAAPQAPAAPHQPAAPQPGVPGAWRLTLYASPTALARWPSITGPFTTNRELDCYSRSNLAPHAGYLALRVTRVRSWCKRVRKPYTGSMIWSRGKYEQKGGLWEARIFFPAKSTGTVYDWPAWWLTGSHEVDIAECMNGRVYQVGHLPNHPQFITRGVHVTRGWHDYAVQITAGQVSWWIDGHQVARLSSTAFGRTKMFAILDMSVHTPTTWNHAPLLVPTVMKVAWVRAWVRA